MGITYVNGSWLPEGQATISVLDHGLLYGDGVFETVVARGGRIHRLGAHLDRLFRGMAALRIPAPHDRAAFADIVTGAVERNAFADAYVKLIVTRGSNGTPLLDPAGCVPGVICLARSYTDTVGARSEWIRNGLRAKTAAVRRPPAQVLDPQIKSLNYLNLVLAKLEATAAGADQALLLDVHGHVCEAPGANVFVLTGDLLRTPDRDILAGITRATVLDLAPGTGLRVRESTVDLYDVYTADEIFLTSTAGGLLPVVAVDGRPIGQGVPGPAFEKLLRAYDAELQG
jgi:branched-chain amino acid aminotransferase